MLDWDRVLELKDEVGEEAFAEVVELFLEEVEEVLTRFRADGVTETIAEDLHFLRGSAMNLGFSDVAEICGAGEKSAKSLGIEMVSLQPLFESYDKSKTMLLSGIDSSFAA
ncbi:hypothetical protein ACMU_01860 [Actibacterium mucosum KCTC 23349]|uniref:HPt domain-containing protein n=1 Tax=Actibacterium mucosum KCTC 23349 TaxID=1454373 RepID=A0A037ZLD5_9RHOB|nr:Hpt domain-containing protein [Actibacterium mucosum]KAJ57266.1 hypothetical protein ACMU_01860 [Actibacterium mucosum KCTC 23349]